MIAGVVVLTFFAFMYCRHARENYWILRDGIQTTAKVTGEGTHNTIDYTYRVGGTTYSGNGHREYREGLPRVTTGGESVVWYSASHPWLSTPRRPDAVFVGFPWLVIVVAMDFLCGPVLLILTWRAEARMEQRERTGNAIQLPGNQPMQEPKTAMTDRQPLTAPSPIRPRRE